MGVEHKTLQTKQKTRTLAGKANSDKKSLSKWLTFWFETITRIKKTKHTLHRRNTHYPPAKPGNSEIKDKQE